jgi:hypothetical protein
MKCYSQMHPDWGHPDNYTQTRLLFPVSHIRASVKYILGRFFLLSVFPVHVTFQGAWIFWWYHNVQWPVNSSVTKLQYFMFKASALLDSLLYVLLAAEDPVVESFNAR